MLLLRFPRFVLHECVELMFVLIVPVIAVFSLGYSARRTVLVWFLVKGELSLCLMGTS